MYRLNISTRYLLLGTTANCKGTSRLHPYRISYQLSMVAESWNLYVQAIWFPSCSIVFCGMKNEILFLVEGGRRASYFFNLLRVLLLSSSIIAISRRKCSYIFRIFIISVCMFVERDCNQLKCNMWTNVYEIWCVLVVMMRPLYVRTSWDVRSRVIGIIFFM